MAQTVAGAIKTAAKLLGISREAYLVNVNNGLKWCSGCKEWHHYTKFGFDSSRKDGLSTSCFSFRRDFYRKNYVPKIRISKKGCQFTASRDGDKKQARARVNHLVSIGLIKHPNNIDCCDCGHIWSGGERRHEYDHYNGYDAEHHTDVESVCTLCHSVRDSDKARQTHCINGHEFSVANTYLKKNGNRMCRECCRVRDKKRVRPDGYWKKVNDKRRKVNGKK